jgi:hypothetical protein
VIAPEGSEGPAEEQVGIDPAASAQPGSPEAQVPPIAQPWESRRPTYVSLPGVIHWPVAWKDALLCGVGAAVLFVLSAPLIRMGGVIWMLAGGALTVQLYRRRIGGAPVTPGMGMRLGAVAGLFGFMANAFTSVVSFVALRNTGNFRHAMEEQMQSQMGANTDPGVQQIMQNLLNYMSTPQGAATMLTVFLLIFGAVFVLLSAAGGAVGATLLGFRRQSH